MTRSGRINERHVDVIEASSPTTFSDAIPNSVSKTDRIQFVGVSGSLPILTPPEESAKQMKLLSSGAAVIENGELSQTEGTRRFRVSVSRAMGARDIAQFVSAYSEGVSAARRNPVGEEALYVVQGTGTCYIDGY